MFLRLTTALTTLAVAAPAFAEEINIYSYRSPN